MTAKIDQKTYLQKYLGGPSEKKKKKKKVVKGKGFKIIDDDLDLSKLQELQGDELDILDQGEDAPQIAGIIDERPEEVRKAELFKSSSKWRVVTQDDGFNTNLQVEEIKRDIKEVEKENEVIFGKMYSDSEDEKKNDSDPSPPRKRPNERHDTPKKTRNASDSDFSPPRKKESNKHHVPSRNRVNSSKTYQNDSDASPARKTRNENDSDLSPPRKHTKENRNRSDSDVSPPRRNDPSSSRNISEKPKRNKERRSRWDNVDDKRNYRNRSNSNSPSSSKKTESSSKNKRKPHKNPSDSDLSPPRQSQKYNKSRRNTSLDTSSTLRKQKKNVDRKKGNEDSVPKKYTKNRSDSDLSPPRKNNIQKNKDKHRNGSGSYKKIQHDSDLSPQGKGNKRSKNKYQDSSKSDSDLSPPRKERKNKRCKERNEGSSLSPPRRDNRKQTRNSSNSPPPTNKKMAKTLEGKLAGLQDAVQLRQENEAFRRREDEAYNRLTDDVSGRNAKAVSRKSKRETSEERQKQKEKAERQKQLDEKYKKWSRGLKQIEAQEERVQDYMHEAAKPLARYSDDQDLEHRLRDIERDGDPMMNYIRDRKRERGELAPAKPTYKGNFPPNRFNIRPGYRWDGVDRSNGYEKKFFDQQSKKKAMEEDAYKWSTEDL